MRRTFACAVVGLAVLGAAVPQAVAQAPVGDSVIGSLFDQETGNSFGVDARSGPVGEDPIGTAGRHVGGGLGPDWTVGVTCLAVDGNTAVIGFSGTFSFLGMPRPVAGLVRVTDGGGPASGQDSFEWAETLGPVDGTPIAGPIDCSSYPAGFPPNGGPVFNRTSGDIIVTDAAPPLPTSKEQCKHGGWQRFGFKNQGDCVSFVASGGTNPPASSR